MSKPLYIAIFSVALLGCRDGNRELEISDSTAVTETETRREMPSTANVDTAGTQNTTTDQPSASNLPPIATPIEPDRLSQYLPELSGYTAEEVQKETRIRPNLKVSKAWRTYRNGDKKIVVTVNDFAYVPSQYIPYEQYRGEYLQDDNIERTESTRISGYEAVQTWLKKENRAEVTVFPGKRYVVQVDAQGMSDISEVRRMIEAMNLSGLEGLE